MAAEFSFPGSLLTEYNGPLNDKSQPIHAGELQKGASVSMKQLTKHKLAAVLHLSDDDGNAFTAALLPLLYQDGIAIGVESSKGPGYELVTVANEGELKLEQPFFVRDRIGVIERIVLFPWKTDEQKVIQAA